jgi:DNA replication protein DnaC
LTLHRLPPACDSYDPFHAAVIVASKPTYAARADGRYTRLLRQLARVDLLILDDWGPEAKRRAAPLLEIVEDRHDTRSIIITSQVPVDRWYEIIGNPTIADAILDRLVHNAYRIELSGESLRKNKSPARLTPAA